VEWLVLLAASHAVEEVWQLTSGQNKIHYSLHDVTIMGPRVQGVDTFASDL
jgi:hypothetical protein